MAQSSWIAVLVQCPLWPIPINSQDDAPDDCEVVGNVGRFEYDRLVEVIVAGDFESSVIKHLKAFHHQAAPEAKDKNPVWWDFLVGVVEDDDLAWLDGRSHRVAAHFDHGQIGRITL